MKRRAVFTGIICGLVLLAATTQSPAQGKDDNETKVISTDPSLTGESGIISTLVADSLPKGAFAIGLFYHNFDREITDLDVNQYAISLAYGLLDNLEIALSVIGNWQLDFDEEVHTETFPPRVLTAFPFPSPTIENGFGDIYLGAKYTFVPDSDRSPGVALRGFVKIPTGNEEEGFGSGATDFGLDFIVSKHVSDRLLVTGNAGFTFLGTPNVYSDSGLDFGNDFRFGLGARLSATDNFRFLMELTGSIPMGDDSFPQSNIVDARLGLEYKLDCGFRFGLGWTRTLNFDKPALRPDGAFAMISFSPGRAEKCRPEQVKISGFARTASGEPIPGVTVTFSNDGGTVSTDDNGFYVTYVPCDWSGTATADKDCWDFSPAQREYLNLRENQEDQDYTGSLRHYLISGYVRLESDDGEGVPGIAVTSEAGSDTTDGKGHYSIEVPCGWGGVITPEFDEAQFESVEPPNRSYSDVRSNLADQNFILMPKPKPAEECDLADIYFDFDSWQLRPESAEKLMEIAECLQRRPQDNILVEGHCCYIGTDEYNLALGEMRAKAIRDFLVEHGVDGSRIDTVSWGESRPIHDNSGESTRRLNRRGHFMLRVK